MADTKVLEITRLEVTYVPGVVARDEDGKVTWREVELSHHSIECKYMPPDLQAQIEAFIRAVEQAHDPI